MRPGEVMTAGETLKLAAGALHTAPVEQFIVRARRIGARQANREVFAMASKCPKCEKLIGSRIKVEAVTASTGIGGPTYRSIVFSCPWCSTAIGAQIDPLAVSADLKASLKKGR
jgi:hypothetical protein